MEETIVFKEHRQYSVAGELGFQGHKKVCAKRYTCKHTRSGTIMLKL